SSSFWSFEENSNQEIFSKINQHISVKDLFRVFVGLQTSKDSVYFLKDCQENKNSVKGYSKELDKEVEIEKEILKPLLMGDSFHRYEKPISNSMVLFPYYRQDNTDVKKMCLYDENELKSKFPKAWEYLKECESILRARENGRLSSDDLWWRYIYPKNQTLFNKEKLLCPDICNNTHFVLDNLGEFYFTTTIYGYVRNEEYKNLDYKYLMAVLNSSLTWWFLQKTSVVMRGGFYRIKPAYIEKFCIPKINSKNEKLADELINLVDEILKAKEQDKNANTQELENKINSLVYKLYNLTDDEIKIIKNKE
ncbi:class I SAM-dependent DNA methyltransferase, partial [Campylobacter jejuni]|nr:class I SAM-dependent DNA methyltransferase [Campylobacter jejuni]